MIEILIAEDDEIIANLIKVNLVKAGYSCTCAYNGRDAAKMMDTVKFDLCLLEYAKTMDYPVIFITAMGSTDNKVKGLKLGADDYITKPFEIVEMLARVESVLRRYRKAENLIVEEDVTIDLASMEVKKNGKQVMLTLKEFNLLVLLVRNKNVALYREVIYENVWGSDYMGDSRTVDLHIQRVRKKLGWEKKIESVYKVGYRLKG